MLSCQACLWQQLRTFGRENIVTLRSGARGRGGYVNHPSVLRRKYGVRAERGDGRQGRVKEEEARGQFELGDRSRAGAGAGAGAGALRRGQRDAARGSPETLSSSSSSSSTSSNGVVTAEAVDQRFIPASLDFRKSRQRQVGKRDSVGPAWEQSPRSWLRSAQALNQRQRYIAATRRNVQENTATDESVLDERRVKKELQYLKDPLALADRVRSLLKDADAPDPAKAYSMVRIASRSLLCTVAWNHVMDFEMSKGRLSQALKAYNEMKKRAQVPDPYTYMILLRGIAEHAHFSQSIGKALSLYHSMASPGSHVQPSIKHTNVMLKVCARAEDMDALWGVAAKIPEDGPGAADHWTFTTILNAMRLKAVMDTPDGLSIEQSARRRESAIIQGRRIWDAVVQKWRAGKILIDENLTCAMGRLLLIGARPRDWDDVFSLVQQTMGIPRLLPKLGTTARGLATHIPPLRTPYTPQDMVEEDLKVTKEADEAKVPDEGEVNLEPRGEFDPVGDALQTVGGTGQGYKEGSAGRLGYAKPGMNTLSLVMEATLKSVARQPAEDYWNLLTNPHGYGIVPDSDNVHMYLRVLRQARASSVAIELLQNYFAPGWDGTASTPARLTPMRKTFRIMLSICVRDMHNPSALENARKAIELMADSLADVDVRAVAMYLKLVSAASTEVMLEEVRRLGPTIMNLRSFFNYSSNRRDGDEEDTLEVFHRLISIYDRLIHHGNLPATTIQELQERKARCTHFVTTKEGRKREFLEEKERSAEVEREERERRKRSWRTSSLKGGYRPIRRSDGDERSG